MPYSSTKEFFEYQFRKDLIDKLNPCSINELELSVTLGISQLIRILPQNRYRSLDLLYLKSIFENFSGQSSGLVRIPINEKISSESSLKYSAYKYRMVCNLHKSRFVFRIFDLLCAQAHRKAKKNLRFKFTRPRRRKKKDHSILFTLNYLTRKHLICIPKKKYYKKHNFRFNIKVVFTCTQARQRRMNTIILVLFFRRLGVLRSSFDNKFKTKKSGFKD